LAQLKVHFLQLSADHSLSLWTNFLLVLGSFQRVSLSGFIEVPLRQVGSILAALFAIFFQKFKKILAKICKIAKSRPPRLQRTPKGHGPADCL